MKAVYIILVILLAAAALGCVGKKGPETSSKVPVAPAAPEPQPSTTVAESEMLDNGNDLAAIDTMLDDSNLDLSFSEISADTFT